MKHKEQYYEEQPINTNTPLNQLSVSNENDGKFSVRLQDPVKVNHDPVKVN